MLANELIDRLERLGLLDQEIVEALREQLEQSGARITPEAVAKLLVDNGQLTKFQATKLIGELRSGQYEESSDVQVAEATVVDDLGMVDEEAVAVDVVGEEDVFAEPVDESVPVAVMAEPIAVEASVVEAYDDGSSPARPTSARIKKPEKENVWDSFKIYGYLGIIVLLILSGTGIYFLLNRQSSDEFIAEANKLYDQQNYEAAQKTYNDFLSSYGQGDQYSSIARTRVVMTELYKDKQGIDVTRALNTAKRLLPTIENEEGFNEERGNLAALLVDIADNIAAAASKAKETPEKQELLARLDEQIAMMDNPLYMTSAMRTTLTGRLQAIAESRSRVERDINRNLRLDESVTKMTEFLGSKETKGAYDVRIELLKEFPELRTNERLVSLVNEASGIQKTLVVPSSKLPEVMTETPAEDTIKSIVLTTREGNAIAGLDEEHVYLRAGGSVLAFSCGDGRLLWRKFVGIGQSHDPLRLDGGEGVVLSNADLLEVQRCDGVNGSIVWRATLGELFGEPVAEGRNVYVPTLTGRLVALDAGSGDPKWVTQIPQNIEVGPGLEPRLGVVYQPGDHSNLYVLNGRDGSSLESFYIGHERGTIAVPPVALLGHVFVFENAGTDYTRVHVLRYDDAGVSLRVAQPPFRLSGNVTVPPLLQDRRVIVLTDRGQVAVYDIEPTAEREQVSLVAEQVASYDRPTSTEMAVGRGQMWITGTRLGRYELQINTGRIPRDWIKYEGDAFIGRPLVFEDALIHARVLRGTSGIRVTAADPKTGSELWRTDVGVPVAMIRQVTNEQKFHVVTSQAALFELDKEALDAGSTRSPIENPGGNGVAMRFENPLRIDEVKSVLVNQESAAEVIVYDPTRVREKLRLVTLAIPGAKASGAGLIAGGGLMLPLDMGRIVLMRWDTGTMLGSPFQPASDPEADVTWTKPVALADDPDQVVIADSRKGMYRLRIGEQMRELSKVELPEPFLGSMARIDGQVLAAASGPAADFLIGRDLVSLQETFRRLLDGRVVWGPVAAGDRCFLQTDDGRIRVFDRAGEQQFDFEVPDTTPIGDPLVLGTSTLLVGKSGWILNIDSASGKVIGSSDLGQPLSGTPLAIGTRLLVPGTEGVVYIVGIPTASE